MELLNKKKEQISQNDLVDTKKIW